MDLRTRKPDPIREIIWQPQPGPQSALIECPVFEIFYGGARGGGKTEASIGDWLQHSAQYGEHAIGIFFRRNLTQLSEVIARTKVLFPKIGATWNEQRKEWKMPGGGRLKFAYLERDSDAENYQGHSYTRVYIEEATNFPSATPIMKLKATLRSGAGVPCGMRLTGNPGGPGHGWVKKRYIDIGAYRVVKESEEIELGGKKITISLDRVFIPSKLKDNPKMLESQPTYILQLRQVGSDALVKAWLDGDWNSIEGSFFDEFDAESHIIPHEFWEQVKASKDRFIQQSLATALRFRAFDWGSAKPFSCGWYILSDGKWGLPIGALLKYREWYGSKSPNVGLKLDAGQVAKGILEREKGERIHYGVADPSIFIRDGGPSIAESMLVTGCVWKPADNKRRPGWEQIHLRLKGPNGDCKPSMLYFLETCDDTIRTLPLLQHDEGDVEDLDTDGEDHAGDETRYACMSRIWYPTGYTGKKGPGFPKLPGQHTINELLAASRARRLQNSKSDY